MTAVRGAVQEAIATWAALAIAVALSSITYALLIGARFSENSALIIAAGILFALIAVARSARPKARTTTNEAHQGADASKRLRNLFESSEGLRAAHRALRIENVTDFRIPDPSGRTALLVRVPASTSSAALLSQLQSSFGVDPLVFETLAIVDDDALVLVTFAQDLSGQVLEKARSAIELWRLTKKEVAKVHNYSSEQWATFATA